MTGVQTCALPIYIADPAGQGEEAFRAARDEIMRCLSLGFDHMVRRALG